MPIIISGDPTKSISLTGDQSKSIQASQVYVPPPAYVIPGLEQSHWNVENATVVGGYTTSIADESGVAPIVGTSGVPYSPNGWSLNGKTLPTVDLDYTRFYANAWATKLSGYTGPVTTAILMRPIFATGGGGSWSSMMDTFGSASTWSLPSRGFGPLRNWASAPLAFRSQTDASNCIRAGAGTWLPSGTHQLIIMEYVGASAATNLGLYRVWVNGTLRTNSTSGFASPSFASDIGDGGRSSATFARFAAWNNWEGGTLLSQMHIWKGALTDQQRNDVTAYLKSISGIA